MRRWLAGVLLGLAVTTATAGTAEVQALLQPVAVLRGEFTQERQIEGFRNPLRSAGRFLLARELGVVWRSERPFASVMVLGRTGLRVDGAVQAAPDVALQRVQRLLLAMIGGDLDALETEFVLEAARDADGWTLAATPRDPLLGQRLRELTLRGARWVEEVRFIDEQGNRTLIRFRAQNATPETLSAAERAEFD